MGKVLYLHGLESGPNAGKAVALRKAGFEVEAPALDTAATAALVNRGSRLPAAYTAALDGPLAQARDALLAFRPDVVVGSSFGGAVLLRLVGDPAWTGAVAVMLAGAGPKMTGIDKLPPGVDVVLVHGRQDDVIPIDDSRGLAASSATALLIEVHDDHRLSATTASGLLAAVVTLAFSRPAQGRTAGRPRPGG